MKNRFQWSLAMGVAATGLALGQDDANMDAQGRAVGSVNFCMVPVADKSKVVTGFKIVFEDQLHCDKRKGAAHIRVYKGDSVGTPGEWQSYASRMCIQRETNQRPETVREMTPSMKLCATTAIETAMQGQKAKSK